jgi:hypothetical protein
MLWNDKKTQACCSSALVPNERIQRARNVLQILAERAARRKRENDLEMDADDVADEMTADEAMQLLSVLAGLKVRISLLCRLESDILKRDSKNLKLDSVRDFYFSPDTFSKLLVFMPSQVFKNQDSFSSILILS